MFHLCSNARMTDSPTQTPPALLLPDEELLAFTPVPMDRQRSNGWTPAQQERFIRALTMMGSVSLAVGMSRQSTLKWLIERCDATPLRCDFSVTFDDFWTLSW